jgi:hypothetical protein
MFVEEWAVKTRERQEDQGQQVPHDSAEPIHQILGTPIRNMHCPSPKLHQVA